MTYPEPSNITTVKGLFDYAETTSGGYFYVLIPISLYIIVFLWLKGKQYDTQDCALASGFLTSLVSIMLFLLTDAFTGFHLFFAIAALAITVVIATLNKE